MSTETTALTPQQSFEEKVKSRMRENIGDLMPDEVLADMVKKAMNEMFFTRREKKADGWGGRTKVLPSWFEDEVSTQLKKQVLEEVRVAVEAKRAELHDVAVKLVTEKMPEMIVSALLGVISQITTSNSYNTQSYITELLRSKGFNL